MIGSFINLVRSRAKTRSGVIITNLFSSLVFKYLNIAVSFVMVPITIGYLDKTRYGLWAALSSMLAWFFIFDIGIGNGLKNKYIELKAKGDMLSVKEYVSTAYAIFAVLCLLIAVVFICFNSYVNWSKILNAPQYLSNELDLIVSLVFISMCANFVIGLIRTLLMADLKNAVNDGLGFLSHLITLFGIVVLVKASKPSLLYFAILYTGANLMVTGIASIILYRTIYKNIAPSLRFIKWKLRKDLVSVGIKFFFIQICGLVLFQTTSFILSNLVGPEAVTDYNISQKYFMTLTMMFNVLAGPLWSGYGDAFHRGDYGWIQRTFSRLKKLWLILVFALLVMLALQKAFFKIWVGERIIVDYYLSLALVVYLTLNMWNNIYNPFINATSKLKLQIYLGMILVPLYIPMAILFVKYLDFGPTGIVMAMIIIQAVPNALLLPIQSKRILANSAGIWNV